MHKNKEDPSLKPQKLGAEEVYCTYLVFAGAIAINPAGVEEGNHSDTHGSVGSNAVLFRMEAMTKV